MYIAFMQNLKNDTNELTKQKQTQRTELIYKTERTFGYQTGKIGEGGIIEEFEVDVDPTRTYWPIQRILLNIM